MSQVIITKISNSIAKELENLSDETKRTKAFHVSKAIEIYVQNYSDFNIALDRFNNPNDKVISSKQMNELLDL